ncbi:MAG: hypothetical protein ABI345_03010 [Jatrophihabitans sp.]
MSSETDSTATPHQEPGEQGVGDHAEHASNGDDASPSADSDTPNAPAKGESQGGIDTDAATDIDYNYGDGNDDGQDYVDRSVIDFDPKDGLFTGTAVDGTSDIPDPDDADEAEVEKAKAELDGGEAGQDGAASDHSDGDTSEAQSDDSDSPKPYPHDGKGPSE